MIDDIDRSILRVIQTDGRKTTTAIAAEVGLTVAPCHRRLRELERSGVITGYRADIDRAAVGLGFEAIVFVLLSSSDSAMLHGFEEQARGEPQIVEAQRLFGEIDYVLRVVAVDLPAYQRFYDEVLSGFTGVQRLTSTIVMKNLKSPIRLPL